MILITGANGQLGSEMRHLLDERDEEYVAVDVAEMDITDSEKVDKVFAEVKPTLIYHCAACPSVFTFIRLSISLIRYGRLH